MDDFAGYSAVFAQLRNVRLSFEHEDVCAEDPQLMQALTALNGAMSNQMGEILQQHVHPEVMQRLAQWMAGGTQ